MAKKGENSCLGCGHDMSRSRCRIASLEHWPRRVLAAYDVRCGKCRKRHVILVQLPKKARKP